MVRTKSVSESLVKFLDQETLTLSLNGAIGCNRTYRKDIDEQGKREFRKSLRGWLHHRSGEYGTERVGEDRHLANIEELSFTLSENHRDVLLDGTFRIGTAQKALNLYLKYCWARGSIPEPPHCPIDSIVLAAIEKCPSSAECRICAEVTWTKIRCTREYLHFVEKAKARAAQSRLSVARWELGVWQAAKFLA